MFTESEYEDQESKIIQLSKWNKAIRNSIKSSDFKDKRGNKEREKESRRINMKIRKVIWMNSLNAKIQELIMKISGYIMSKII